MASIPVTVIKMAEKSCERVNLTLPSGGANFTDGWISDGRTKCVSMKNIVPSDTSVKTSGTFVPLSESAVWNGSFHSMTRRPYSGRMMFHAGNCIYSFMTGSTYASVLFEGVPDSNSMFCEFASKLYFYCGTYVYSIDRNFNVTEELPEAPLIKEEVDGEYGTGGKFVEKPRINLIAPRVSIAFKAASRSGFELPTQYKCDTSRPIKAYAAGVEKTVAKSRCTEGRIALTNDTEEVVTVIEYYLKNPEVIEFDGFFSTCTCCINYGGTDVGGTRIIAGASSNSDRCGEYCKSELVNPLYFPCDGLEKLGDGCDTITGFVKAQDKLIIFTDRSVYRMEYSMTSEGGLFSIRQINDSIGCDIPGSIRLAGSNVVFASSEKGIFTVNYSDETGRYNVMPISGNINDGQDGLLSCDVDDLKNACSDDFEGRYMLTAGNRIYVWDYSKCGYSVSTDYGKAQGRLIWYTLEGTQGGKIFCIGRDLYCLSESNGIIKKYGMTSLDGTDEYGFITEQQDFGSPMHKKLISDIHLKLRIENGGKVLLSLLRDGKVYCRKVLRASSDETVNFHITPPLVPMYGFSFGLSSCGTAFELSGVSVKLSMAE